MSRRRKPAGTSKQQGTSTTRNLEVVRDADDVVEGPIPEPPPGLSAKSVERWGAFWRSKLAGYVDVGADLHRLERWIADVDEFDRLREAYDRKPTVEGSKGQPRLNPLASRLGVLERQIKDAEGQFGMTPAARLKLGISFGAGGGPTTADDLNRMIEGDGGEDTEVEDEVAAGFVEA